MTPTQRTLAILRERGWPCQKAEYWNPFARRTIDLFGCIDIVAITSDGILGIQTTTADNHAKRRHKAEANPDIAAWIKAGGRFEIWSWNAPTKTRRKWSLRVETLE